MALIETGLAFVEGLALIASPCILPILPLVLSASVDSGRRRPYGIICGFVIAFSAFALLSRQLVEILHIDLTAIHVASLVLLFAFGVVMLSSTLSARFASVAQGAADIGNRFTAQSQGGFISGVLIGSLIGLIWTPCAGPIFATVLIQIIREESDLQSLAIILAFAIGAGIPMLIIALTGRSLISRFSVVTRHAENVRKCVGVIIIASVAVMVSSMSNGSATVSEHATDTAAPVTGLQDALAEPYDAPEFAGIHTWLNSTPLTMQALRGKVVLIDFWTYSCINCVRTLPYVTQWDKKYRDKGLVVIGVHAPEFEFEKDVENVKQAIAAHHIEYPVALDNHFDTWSNFHNRYWPAHYLINREGKVVATHFGEGHYDITEQNIRFLLGLNNDHPNQAKAAHSDEEQTPETYLGYKRAARFANTESIHDETQTYVMPKELPLHAWGLQGKWQINGQEIVSRETNASLRFHIKSQKVFLVLGTHSSAPVSAHILLNGKPVTQFAGKDVKNSVVTVDKYALYELIDQHSNQAAQVEISADSQDLEAYAFTFGN